MDILSELSRQTALELIWVAEQHFHLRIKGGLQALNMMRTAKGYKMTSHQARDEFQRIWNQTQWSSRDSIVIILSFILRAYKLVPKSRLHDQLDQALLLDGLRIRDDELRRIVTVR